MLQYDYNTMTYQSQDVNDKDFIQSLLAPDTIQTFTERYRARKLYENKIIPFLTEGQVVNWKACAERVFLDPETERVISVNECRHRFCAICNWRAARKRYAVTLQTVNEIKTEFGEKIRFIFLTLTISNPRPEDLSHTIDAMLEALNRLQSRKSWKKRVLGAIRSLEITYKEDADTFHPHFHFILAVPKEYFTDPDLYWDTLDWADAWQSAMNLDYTPSTKVEAVQETEDVKIENMVAEISKYAIKLSSIVHISDVSRIRIALMAVKQRRLNANTGIFRIITKRLKELEKAEKNQTFKLHGNFWARDHIEERYFYCGYYQ